MPHSIKELQARVDALQQRLAPKAGIAERLKKARERWRALTPDQQAAARAEREARALSAPEPMAGTMRHALWQNARRLAARRASGA